MFESIKILSGNHQTGKSNLEVEGLDLEGDLEDLRKNIAKLKRRKFGNGLKGFEINDLNWIEMSGRKIKAVAIFIYETSV